MSQLSLNFTGDQLPNVTNPLSTLDVIVGTAYIVEAVVLIWLHILCAYLMYTDKDMKNATYAFMINLSIIDCIELSMIGVYAGIVILTKCENAIIDRIAGFLCLGAWYANCALFPLIAMSRWVFITRPHLVPKVFGKKILWSLQIGSWLILGIPSFYGNILYPPDRIFPFFPFLLHLVVRRDQRIGSSFHVG